MSLKDYIKVREYIVTANSLENLDDLYYELETDNVAPPNTELTRPVRLAEKRPVSRNTHYWLTDWEADQLRFDPRVRVVELHPRYRGISAGTTTSTQTSSNWNKSNSTASTMKNFALLRCTEGVQRAGWGSNGSTQTQTGTITLNATGKNVDVVVVDDNGLVWNHPEYAVNADGSGGSRAVQYNWGQHDPVVKGTPASNYSYGVGSHSTHVAGTVAGNTQGWARDANIYNIYYLAGDLSNYNFPYVMDYVREFHRTKSVNVSTGRKNPTVTNNSWGMSIFPSEWTFSDITAVTYRGTRFTPESGGTTFAGISGVFTASTKLADLVGLANAGNRIVTAGSTVDPSTRLLSKPSSWTQDGGQTYLAYVSSSDPDPLYTVTVQGPCLVEVRNNIASGGFNGTTTLTVGVEILQGATSIANFSQGPTSGGDVELIIDEIVTLPNNAVYTINYTSTLNNDTVENPITAVSMSTSITVIGGTASATVTPIANTFGSTTGLTFEQVPDFGNNDDGYWQLSLPFSITYCGAIYNEIYVGTNFYLTFGGGSNVYSGLGPGTPGYPKIMLTAADNSVQRIYYGTSGVSPDRTFRVRIEGTNRTSGILGSPNMLAEYTFYENAANRIDLQVGVNAQGSATGTFSGTQLNAWGFISGQRIPVRVSALDADIENAQEEGILYVGAAGNGRWKHDLPGGLDWDNTFEMNNRYPGQVYYYMRGTSPTANDSIAAGGNFNLNTICVGAVDVTAIETQSSFSDTGPGVDLHAPGTAIISSMPSGVTDPRSASHYLGKLSGTSMASPQVCGVLACALEIYPNMTPAQAKNYILGYAKKNQLTNNGGGPTDTTDLQGSANLYLYYPQERPTTGNVFPKKNYQFRPTTGNVYPRPKIRAKG